MYIYSPSTPKARPPNAIPIAFPLSQSSGYTLASIPRPAGRDRVEPISFELLEISNRHGLVLALLLCTEVKDWDYLHGLWNSSFPLVFTTSCCGSCNFICDKGESMLPQCSTPNLLQYWRFSFLKNFFYHHKPFNSINRFSFYNFSISLFTPKSKVELI